MTLRTAAALLVFVPAIAWADVSATIDLLWDYGRPEASEARFRAERATRPERSREALELDTQIARAQALQRRFDAAHATLDTVVPALPTAQPRVHVRYLLERGRRVGLVPEAVDGPHRDAVDRAGRNAELAAAAKRVDHRVHAARPADDRVDRACLDADRAADAACLVDDGDGERHLDAAARVDTRARAARERRECGDRRVAAGRAAVDRRVLARDRVRVGGAIRVAAARALRLRQQRIDGIGGDGARRHVSILGPVGPAGAGDARAGLLHFKSIATVRLPCRFLPSPIPRRPAPCRLWTRRSPPASARDSHGGCLVSPDGASCSRSRCRRSA